MNIKEFINQPNLNKIVKKAKQYEILFSFNIPSYLELYLFKYNGEIDLVCKSNVSSINNILVKYKKGEAGYKETLLEIDRRFWEIKPFYENWDEKASWLFTLNWNIFYFKQWIISNLWYEIITTTNKIKKDFLDNLLKKLYKSIDGGEIKYSPLIRYNKFSWKFEELTKYTIIDNYYYSAVPKNYISVWWNYWKVSKLTTCPVCWTPHFISNPVCNCWNMDGYHNSRNNTIKTTSLIRVGLELERDKPLIASDVIRIKKEGFRYERDGSVQGWEIISPVLWLAEAIYKFKKLDYIFPNEKLSASCWGHIHLSLRGVEREKLYNEIEHFRPILWAIFPKRIDGRFCSKDSWLNARYRDLSLANNYWTIEFRIFPWVEVYEDVKFRLSLIKFFVKYKNSNKKKAIKNLIDNKSELINILLMRYNNRVIPWILTRINWYLNTTLTLK